MATLTLSIKEDLIIGGKQQGTTTTKEITGVNNAYCRYYVVDNTEDTVVDFQADRSGGGAVENQSYILFFDSIDAESTSSGLGGSFAGSQLGVIKAVCSASDGATLEVLIAQS